MLEEIKLQQVLPQEIEKRSFEIITEEFGRVKLDPLQAPIIKRAIHTYRCRISSHAAGRVAVTLLPPSVMH